MQLARAAATAGGPSSWRRGPASPALGASPAPPPCTPGLSGRGAHPGAAQRAGGEARGGAADRPGPADTGAGRSAGGGRALHFCPPGGPSTRTGALAESLEAAQGCPAVPPPHPRLSPGPGGPRSPIGVPVRAPVGWLAACPPRGSASSLRGSGPGSKAQAQDGTGEPSARVCRGLRWLEGRRETGASGELNPARAWSILQAPGALSPARTPKAELSQAPSPALCRAPPILPRGPPAGHQPHPSVPIAHLPSPEPPTAHQPAALSWHRRAWAGQGRGKCRLTPRA